MDVNPPDLESRRPAPHVATLEYANLNEAGSRGEGLATASVTCGVLFFAAVGVWAGEGIGFLLLAILFAFLAVGCGLSARSVERREGNRPRRRTSWGLSLGSLELVLVLAFAIALPQMGRQREPAKRIMCGSNLRQIGQAVLLYSVDNRGQFPPDVDAIMLTGEITFEVLVCPSTNDTTARGATTQASLQHMHAQAGHCSYVYIGGGLTSATVTSAHVIAYEPISNHEGTGMNVLFGDGHVEFVEKVAAEPLLAELKAGHNPPRTHGDTTTTKP